MKEGEEEKEEGEGRREECEREREQGREREEGRVVKRRKRNGKWRESTISKEPEKISATGGRNKSAKVFSFLTSVGSCFCVACARAYLRTLCSSRDSRS